MMKAKAYWEHFPHVSDLGVRGFGRSKEEAPEAYKDVSAVVEVSDRAGLARKVVRLKPVICIKG